MSDNSEDEVFFDAIGDEAQIQAIQEQKKEGIEVLGVLGEPFSRSLSKEQSTDSRLDKLEEGSDVSRNTGSHSVETSISKSGSEKASRPDLKPSKKSFLGSFKKEKEQFQREDVKQNHKNYSNFGSLTCLQFFEDEKRQSLESSGKKEKNVGAIWVAKFSPDNKHIATGGSDGVLRIYNLNILDPKNMASLLTEQNCQLLDPNYTRYEGHKFDIVDISWYQDSKLILTSSIDKTVRLWNTETQRLVKIFEHSDIVSCLSFHPLVNEFFATGCFDKIIRIWDLNETKVVDWVQTADIITALTFSPDKNHLLVGFYKGIVKVYRTDKGKLKFIMEITCKNSFSWGKINKIGKKVTGIVFTEDYEFLVTTNDSRMRLIDFKNYQTKIKYKGHSSGKFHIQPSYNAEKEMVISGSEDGKVYIWNKMSDYVPQINPVYTRQKKNRNTSYEYFKPFIKSNTTCTVWLPYPALKMFREAVLSTWKDVYADNVMILFSSDSKIKVLGNMIELESDLREKK